LQLTHEQIKQILPHRYPMLLVDSVRSVQLGERIVALKAVAGNEPCYAALQDHGSPARAAYPASLILESFCQAAAILWLLSVAGGEEKADPIAVILGSVTNVQFESDVFPGELMEHRGRIDRRIGQTTLLSGETWVSDRLIMRVEQVTAVAQPASLLRNQGEAP
jgi:3-hydroxyacyl-[acyl-carrier-protein] dehydratase